MLWDPCSSKLAVNLLEAKGHTGSEKPGSDILKILQQIQLNEKKKQSRKWRWSRERFLNPFLPSGNDKERYVFAEEILEFALFAEVFATGPNDPLENKYCFYCILC